MIGAAIDLEPTVFYYDLDIRIDIRGNNKVCCCELHVVRSNICALGFCNLAVFQGYCYRLIAYVGCIAGDVMFFAVIGNSFGIAGDLDCNFVLDFLDRESAFLHIRNYVVQITINFADKTFLVDKITFKLKRYRIASNILLSARSGNAYEFSIDFYVFTVIRLGNYIIAGNTVILSVVGELAAIGFKRYVLVVVEVDNIAGCLDYNFLRIIGYWSVPGDVHREFCNDFIISEPIDCISPYRSRLITIPNIVYRAGESGYRLPLANERYVRAIKSDAID